MATKIIDNQLEIAASLYKNTMRSLIQKDGGYIVPEDFAGSWTTGYIADMGGITREEAASEAKLLYLKNKIQRYVTEEAENKPKLASILPSEAGEPVTDIMTDFRDTDTVKLISENKVAWVKGRYLAHFVKNYAGCDFEIIEALKPVLVTRYGSEREVIGLIMPVRMEEI